MKIINSDKVNTPRLIQTFKELISIDSPSLGERSMADELTRRFSMLGFDVSEDDAGSKLGGNAGNLLAVRSGKLPGDPILFSAHMDSVDPCTGKKMVLCGGGRMESAGGRMESAGGRMESAGGRMESAGGRIESDGTTVLGADCMAGVCAVLEALLELSERSVPTRSLEILLTVGEERHALGSALFDYTQLNSRESYILDMSGEVGTAAVAAPTILNFEITIIGKAAHAGFEPEKGAHAIAAAARAVSRMRIGRTGGMTVNIGSIHGGGKSTNIVPDRCVLKGEIRSLDHEKVMAEIKRIDEIFREEAAAVGARSNLNYNVPVHAYSIPDDHPSIRRFKAACRALSLPGELVSTFGGSDQCNLSLHGIYGPVLSNGMMNVHSCTEYILVDDLCRLTALVMLLATGDGGNLTLFPVF